MQDVPGAAAQEDTGQVTIHSGYRTRAYNANDRRGEHSSMHVYTIHDGNDQAADITCKRGTPRDWHALLNAHPPAQAQRAAAAWACTRPSSTSTSATSRRTGEADEHLRSRRAARGRPARQAAAQEADLPEDGLDVDDLEPEEVPEADFLTPGDARDDQTVDDTEDDTTPGE